MANVEVLDTGITALEVEEVRRDLDGDSALERVVFAVHGDAARAAFEAALA